MIALYAGHIAIMAWAIQIFDSRFVVSLVWATLALGCLLLALKNTRQGARTIFIADLCRFRVQGLAV